MINEGNLSNDSDQVISELKNMLCDQNQLRPEFKQGLEKGADQPESNLISNSKPGISVDDVDVRLDDSDHTLVQLVSQK